MTRICIDIGHGSNTYPPSKGIGNFAEWSFNNAVGRIAKELAEVNGFSVYLSQPLNETEVPLNRRISNINKTICEAGISIHANYASNTQASGHEFWYWHTSEQSRKLATLADANAIALLPNKRRGLKQSTTKPSENFGILRATKMPFTLCEFGFYSNDSDLKLLKSEQFQILCAKVVVKTLCDYFGKPFRTIPQGNVTPPKQIPQWKVEPLQRLYKDGLIHDYHDWLLKLDDNAPNWLIFTLIDRLNQELKKK